MLSFRPGFTCKMLALSKRSCSRSFSLLSKFSPLWDGFILQGNSRLVFFLATFQYFTTFAGREVSTFFEKQCFADLFLNDDQLERLIERPLANLYFQIQTKSKSSLKVDLQNSEWDIPEKIETGELRIYFLKKPLEFLDLSLYPGADLECKKRW